METDARRVRLTCLKAFKSLIEVLGCVFKNIFDCEDLAEGNRLYSVMFPYCKSTNVTCTEMLPDMKLLWIYIEITKFSK